MSSAKEDSEIHESGKEKFLTDTHRHEIKQLKKDITQAATEEIQKRIVDKIVDTTIDENEKAWLVAQEQDSTNRINEDIVELAVLHLANPGISFQKLHCVNLKAPAHEIRHQMAEAGWHSNDNYTTFGWGADKTTGKSVTGYSIWFERWDWHARKMDKATYGAFGSDHTKAQELTAQAARIAIRAWNEFPDAPPNQGIGDVLTDRSEWFAKLLAKTPRVDDGSYIPKPSFTTMEEVEHLKIERNNLASRLSFSEDRENHLTRALQLALVDLVDFEATVNTPGSEDATPDALFEQYLTEGRKKSAEVRLKEIHRKLKDRQDD